jgi:hypothetical protein
MELEFEKMAEQPIKVIVIFQVNHGIMEPMEVTKKFHSSNLYFFI